MRSALSFILVSCLFFLGGRSLASGGSVQHPVNDLPFTASSCYIHNADTDAAEYLQPISLFSEEDSDDDYESVSLKKKNTITGMDAAILHSFIQLHLFNPGSRFSSANAGHTLFTAPLYILHRVIRI